MVLPSLRDELQLHPGPIGGDGEPTWTLHDPVRNRFFRLGWSSFEMLARWHLDGPEAVAAAVSTETTISLGADDVVDLLGFLSGNELLKLAGPEATARMLQRVTAAKQSWGQWLLHHYLFFRVPLVRPDRFLTRTLPHMRWAFSRGFAITTLAALVAGLFLIIRQWETFGATLVDTISPSGMVMYGVTLAGVKVFHELGHGYATKRLGCRVPTMGAAFLVMWPVLYTDVNETWKLVRRRDRLSVAAAGVLVELAVAAWATLAWGLLPDGAVRGAAFMLGTTTWISSVLLNLSPFMRFDGYFLLMDALEMPNLHNRAFAVARWWLRELLFKLGEPPPEHFSPTRQRALVGFAVAVWIYRLVLFLGIAALVYHFFIKAVGILLFAVEMGWFVFMPFWGEFRQWWMRRRSILGSGRSLLPLGGFLAVLALAVAPWQCHVTAPAMLKAERQAGLYAASPGRVERVMVTEGQMVAEGATLLALSSPDLDHRQAQAERRSTELEYELESTSFDNTLRDRSQALREELETVLAERVSLQREQTQLSILAPMAGRIVDMSPDLRPGQWVSPKDRLALIVATGAPMVEAFVAESDVARLRVGTEGNFIGEDPGRPDLPCRIVAIDRGSVGSLTEAALASVAGGPISVRAKDKALVPEHAVYRVSCVAAIAPLSAQLRGVAVLTAEPASPAGAAFRSALAVLMRESGL
jgi:putative peptide zinc metalloprotease protein